MLLDPNGGNVTAFLDINPVFHTVFYRLSRLLSAVMFTTRFGHSSNELSFCEYQPAARKRFASGSILEGSRDVKTTVQHIAASHALVL